MIPVPVVEDFCYHTKNHGVPGTVRYLIWIIGRVGWSDGGMATSERSKQVEAGWLQVLFSHLGMVNWQFHQVSLSVDLELKQNNTRVRRRLTITVLLFIVHNCRIALFACIRSGLQQGTRPCASTRCGCSDTVLPQLSSDTINNFNTGRYLDLASCWGAFWISYRFSVLVP